MVTLVAGEVGGVIGRAEGGTAGKVQCVCSNGTHSMVPRLIKNQRKGPAWYPMLAYVFNQCQSSCEATLAGIKCHSERTVHPLLVSHSVMACLLLLMNTCASFYMV